jgi:hypothetical protein
MKKLIFVSSMVGALALLGGCMAYASPQGVGVQAIEIDEPEVAIGFYDAQFGFWTGSEWDRDYYERGHGGFGHERYHGNRYVDHGNRGHRSDNRDEHRGERR